MMPPCDSCRFFPAISRENRFGALRAFENRGGKSRAASNRRPASQAAAAQGRKPTGNNKEAGAVVAVLVALWKMSSPASPADGSGCVCGSRESEEPPVRTLEVESLSKVAHMWEVEELFSQYGRIEQSEMTLRNGQLETLVTFYTAEDARRALEDGNSNKYILHNRVLLVWPPKYQPPRPKKEAKTESTETAVIDGDRRIETLSDRCLTEIFLCLAIEERIRIERVCKRWQSLIQRSWSRDKRLTLDRSTWRYLRSPKATIDRENLRKILHRCGGFLREINLPYTDAESCSDALSDVARLCPNLRVVNAGMSAVSADSIELLAENCGDVRRLTLNAPECSGCSALSVLFRRSARLTHLMIGFKLAGELLDLPASVRVLELESCDAEEFACLAEVLPRLKKLSELRLSYREDKEDAELPVALLEALGHCGELAELDVVNVASAGARCKTLLTELADLRVLRLSCEIDDAFLLELSGKCRSLVELDVNSRHITLPGIQALTALPKLRKLNISELPCRKTAQQAWQGTKAAEIRRLPRIRDFPSLRHLEYWHCYSLSPGEILCLVESSPRIALVDFCCYQEEYGEIIEWLIGRILAGNSGVVFEVWYNDQF